MKKHKNIIVYLLVIAVMVLVAGCGSKEKTTEIDIATLTFNVPGSWQIDQDNSTVNVSEFYKSESLSLLIGVDISEEVNPYVTALAFDLLRDKDGYTIAQVDNDAMTAVYYGYKQKDDGTYTCTMQIVQGLRTYTIVTTLDTDEDGVKHFFEVIGTSAKLRK